MDLEIIRSKLRHKNEIIQLYKNIADLEGGIIRCKNEINDAYVSEFLNKSIEHGLSLVGITENKIVAEIHAHTPDIRAFQHILTDLTIVVDRNYQGKGIGRTLFEKFLEIVKTELTHILRIELYTREQNKRNVKFYESLGFINEGRQKDKIYVSHSVFETPLHMAWFNPNYKPYKKKELNDYS